METRTTILNFQPGTSIPVVHVSQYDVGVLLRFILYDGSEMAEIEGGSGTSVVIAATRPSGTGFSVPCSIIASNIVEVATTEAMTKEFGIMDAEIRYTNDGDSVGTGNFKFLVEAASHADYIIDEDHAEWVRIAQEVANDRASAQSAKVSAQQSAVRAETAADRVTGEVDKAIAAAATATNAKNAAVTAKSAAETAAENAEASALTAGDAVDAAQLAADDAEAYAVGTRGGEPVTSTDPTYHNNSKYYAELGGAANLADAFSTSTVYAVDDYVLLNGMLYRFTAAHAAGAWNSAHVIEVKAMDEVSDLKGDLNNIFNNNFKKYFIEALEGTKYIFPFEETIINSLKQAISYDESQLYIWKYHPHNGKLSDQEYITATFSGVNAKEELYNGYTRLEALRDDLVDSGSELCTYIFEKSNGTTRLIVVADFSDSDKGAVLRLELSNGTRAAQVFIRVSTNDTIEFFTYEGETVTNTIDTGIDARIPHRFLVRYNNTETISFAINSTLYLYSRPLSLKYSTQSRIMLQSGIDGLKAHVNIYYAYYDSV